MIYFSEIIYNKLILFSKNNIKLNNIKLKIKLKLDK